MDVASRRASLPLPAALARWTTPLFARVVPPSHAELEHACALARRIVAARLALACARERLIDGALVGDALVVAPAIELPLARVRALELHTPELVSPRHPMLEDPLALWHWIAATLTLAEPARERIAVELSDGVHNLALALVAVHWRRQLASRCADDPRVIDGEHVVVQGHPWHPMNKTRLGLRTSEVLRHAPEWLAEAPLVAVDVPRALARVSGPWVETVAPIVGLPPAGLVRIPVHAAQWRRLAALDDVTRRMVPRGVVARGRALLSVRTVAVHGSTSHGSPLHLKLSLDVLTTSARRIVSPMSVANGAPVSELLARISARDPIARGEPELVVLAEPAAAGLAPAAFGDTARHLGAIARDARALAHAPAIVCAALGDRWPDGTVGLDRLTAACRVRDRGRALVRAYIDGLVPPVLRLLVAHGVALEVHLQNTLVRWDGCSTASFVVRDLGGIRLHRGRLAAAGHAIALDPASFIVTDDLADVVGKTMHTLVHAHMAALFGWVEDAYAVSEAENWALLRATIEGLFMQWSTTPELRAACVHDRAVLLAPRCRAKALFRMRIDERVSDYDWVELANPLAAT